MKLKNKPFAALTCAALIGSVAISQAEILISDDFSYADGGLNQQNGGTGWGSNVWFDANSSVSGGVAVGGGTSASKRNFADTLGTSAGATATVWVRFDWGHSVQVEAGSGYGGLTFYNGTSDGGSELFLFGNPWWGAATDGEWNISGGTGDQNTGISSNGMKSGVAKFDLGAGTVSLWVGATGSTIDVSRAPDASVAGISTLADIKGIRINGYNSSASQSFDNLVIGTTMADVNATSTTYDSWASSFDPDIGLPSADDDNDGVTNFEEYAFGLIPNSGASANPITAPLNKLNGQFSYTRRTNSGLTYSVWFSTDLVKWDEDLGATEGTTVKSGENETVPVTLSTAVGDPLPAKLFVQVRAQ